MKIVFLDIDGVVNNIHTIQRFQGFVGINPELADKVKAVIKTTGCEIVLSSTWRLNKNSRDHVREKVCDFIDITGHLPRGTRGEEIDLWLKDNAHLDIKCYAILDDNTDFYPEQPLFKTSWEAGITDEIVENVISYFKQKETK